MGAQVRILGPIEVELPGGRRADVPRGRTLAFLALLLTRHGAALHVDRIVDELWEQRAPQHARAAVQVLASRLRAAAGDDLVAYEGGGYAARPAELDADRFEAAARRGREAARARRPGRGRGGAARGAGALARRGARGRRRRALRPAGDRAARGAPPRLPRRPRRGRPGARIHRGGRRRARRARARAPARRAPPRAADDRALPRRPPGRRAGRLPRRPPGARRGARRRAVAAAARARGGDPAPGPPGAPAPAQAAALAAARRWVTCVFAQTAGPALDPETLQAGLERFHAVAERTCGRHRGRVVELRGDAVVAVFGIPVAHEDDAQRAIAAAAELVAAARLPFGLGVRCGSLHRRGPRRRRRPRRRRGDRRRGAARARRRHAARSGSRTRRGASSGTASARPASRTGAGGCAGSTPTRPRSAAGTTGRSSAASASSSCCGRRSRASRAAAPRRSSPCSASPGSASRGSWPSCPAWQGPCSPATVPRAARACRCGRSERRSCRRAATGRGRSSRRTSRSRRPRPCGSPRPSAWRRRTPAAASCGRSATCSARSRGSGRWCSSSTTRTAPSPRCSTSSPPCWQRSRSVPVLLVWVARADEPAGRPAGGTELVLHALSPAASRSLIANLAGADGGEERIVAAAGGNPLFLEQLVAYVGERTAPETLPPALHALLAARLDGLGATERATLALASVTGDRCDPAAVQALATGMTRADVERACDRLAERDLLVAADGGLRFRHTLIRDAAYASLAKSERARLHERHAAWLDARPALPDADAKVGFHLEAAHRLGRRGRRSRVRRARGARRTAAGGRGRRRTPARRPGRRDRPARARERAARRRRAGGGGAAPGPRLGAAGGRRGGARRGARRARRRRQPRARPRRRPRPRGGRARAAAALVPPGVVRHPPRDGGRLGAPPRRSATRATSSGTRARCS